MAINLKEAPLPVQIVMGLVVAVLVIAAGLYLPVPPVHGVKQELERAQGEKERLDREVNQLRQYERRYAELKAGIEAREKQLATLREIVPEEKEVDEFMRTVNASAAASNVMIRRMTARPIAPREYHVEMPFEFEVDGPYYNVLNFFARLSRLPRIINVGDMNFGGLGERTRTRYPVAPGTTVTGTFVATTFFTKGAESTQPQQPGKRPGKAPAKQPGKN